MAGVPPELVAVRKLEGGGPVSDLEGAAKDAGQAGVAGADGAHGLGGAPESAGVDGAELFVGIVESGDGGVPAGGHVDDAVFEGGDGGACGGELRVEVVGAGALPGGVRFGGGGPLVESDEGALGSFEAGAGFGGLGLVVGGLRESGVDSALGVEAAGVHVGGVGIGAEGGGFGILGALVGGFAGGFGLAPLLLVGVDVAAVDVDAVGDRGEGDGGGEGEEVGGAGEVLACLDEVVAAAFEGADGAVVGGAGDDGADEGSLAGEGGDWEVVSDEGFELRAGEFQDVIGVGGLVQGGVDVAVGGAEDEEAVGSEDAAEFGEKLVLFGEVFEGFKRDGDVDGGGFEGEGAGVAVFEAEDGVRELATSGFHGGRVDLDADGGAGDLGEEGGAVAFAGCHVEDVFAAAEVSGEEVAVVVFDLDLAGDGGCQALTAEGQGVGGPFALDQFTHFGGGWSSGAGLAEGRLGHKRGLPGEGRWFDDCEPPGDATLVVRI